jgi:hypothetical protein
MVTIVAFVGAIVVVTGLAAVSPPNPQSWNRYAYVMNTAEILTA